ncbi:class I SAM-dependent methyltransferase [Streptacidiphilus fuscans]|uniref:Class I SAM-dependent methyltransferase n=1 Tax=Streptacidiphilus fuscans TaxID=2789292 RepID=A0A931B0A0_9ACTN|nr:class I SAM-dependent methyltransferase [Streptacidiphilus fuscans]MBF9068785.1 class I SAM-dependent methyltransferase [Streptacidiphilus fuscans]
MDSEPGHHAAGYSDADDAALYDLLNPWEPEVRPSGDAFYTDLVMAADSVLDVGCGTGLMLRHARAHGHGGRLVGLDPDVASLARARRRDDVEWVEGRAAEARWQGEFALATMVSHAFQCLVTDEELRSSLTAIRAALRDDGVFAFETRHPQARAWESWTSESPSTLVDGTGRTLLVSNAVESVTDGVVTVTETTSAPDGTVLRVGRDSLRFLEVDALDAFLAEAGFTVTARYGDWSGGPLDERSREIVMVARRA